ncbi:hypothetical protein, partial [Thiohalobacter thiocyanaticus]|uniref:hypothetical protein n=1 Tax=Thiohalobacter thiocyanaticus TaxID=585455 RepID=UPI0019D4886F
MSGVKGNYEPEIAGGPILGDLNADALVELCDRGLLTCTRGRPGEAGATYAVAWLPLDDPESYS